jgi:hypothetical protein
MFVTTIDHGGDIVKFKRKINFSWAPVAQAYNPSYSGG